MTTTTKKERKAEFTKWMGPLLDALRELGGSGRPKEVVDQIAKKLNIPDSKLEEMKNRKRKIRKQQSN